MTEHFPAFPVDFRHDALDSRIVGRSESYFASDMLAASDEISALVRGRRLLVIGGAGSIGFQTLATLAQFEPAVLHVIDHNENGLAEVVRRIRSAPRPPKIGDLLTLPFDYGGAPFRLWFKARSADYDLVLNFAALKHVRSEKDPYSILAMLETNLMRLDTLAQLIAQSPGTQRLFCVSTDKAANPSSMMGATKRLMEHALFSPAVNWAPELGIASARFANVALSNGSLLQSWQIRLALRQPMACPENTRRFFVTLPESGHLCTLAALLGEDRSVMVPTLDPARHLVLLEDVAMAFLQSQGLTPFFTRDEDEARLSVERLLAEGKYPMLLTPLDTAGEKPYEEFVGKGEQELPTRFASLNHVPYIPPEDPASLPGLIAGLRQILASDGETLSIDRLKEMIAGVEAGFRDSHVASAKSLDQRI
ncbi:polysaccharide biosynthesis protein [Pseudogemmobacter faecipullorum]|uniref:Polysaccharide biosynthesis protein n=1 Tax=Pseudogemmobacter faecipullorum TaxID=2755041 RepID=A0ABS8CGE0_9RHOB|nr:polysaccharide biosynthesis protein [Pseudogemmobacter faecipullorum]MCB5408449.1 polysaccharide biosynthesis protein [Pseudogemmobacter faecipullorum]